MFIHSVNRLRVAAAAGVPASDCADTSHTEAGHAEPYDSYSPGKPASLERHFDPVLLSMRPHTAEENQARIQVLLDKEWKYFGRQAYRADGTVIRVGKKENESSVYKRVGYYWQRGTGLNYDGRDRNQPWSAAFISTMHRDSNVGPQFKRSPAHAKYIRDAISKKQAGDTSAAYWGYRLSERAPQIGDMVAYSRQKGIDYDHQPEYYKSHCDVVVAVRPGEIDVIGGNVGDSVSKKTLSTDQAGLLTDQRHNWFAVLAPNDLSSASIGK